jgi:hypothetical protein
VNSKLYLFMSVPPERSVLDPIREAIDRLVMASLGQEHGDALSMVACELLYNAMQHGMPEAGAIHLSLVVELDNAIVSVANPVDVQSPHLSSLKRRLSWLQSFPSAGAAYVAALRQVFDAPTDGTLGLARVVFEGGCALSCEIERPGWIAVRAVRALQSV